jgi:hypothetical protein
MGVILSSSSYEPWTTCATRPLAAWTSMGKHKGGRRTYGMRTGLRVLMAIIMYLIIGYFIFAGVIIALAFVFYLGIIGG